MSKGSKLRSAETKTHDVMNGKVEEYDITFIKPRNLEKGRYLVSRVSIKGKAIWDFKNENFHGIALLENLKGVLCICLVSREKEVEKVIPLDTLTGEEENKHRLGELKSAANRKIRK